MNAPTAESEPHRPPAIEARAVWRMYARQPVLQAVDLAVAQKERVAIMGPSGCGKTTLLNVLGGIDRPDRGDVSVDGEPLVYRDRSLTSLHRTAVGFVFQGYGLIPSLTVAENVEFTMLAKGVDAETRSARALSLLVAVGLGDYAERYPEELSGGQRQRVAVARSLAHSPRVVLADEPTGNLDHHSALQVIGILVRVCREQGAALVVVTHDAEVAAEMERVVHMRDGRVLVASDTDFVARRARTTSTRQSIICEGAK